MSEKNVIERTATPLTVNSLTEQLRACGLAEGQSVLVHLARSRPQRTSSLLTGGAGAAGCVFGGRPCPH